MPTPRILTGLLVSFAIILGAVFAASFFANKQPAQDEAKIKVVATLFPLYDFVKNIGGNKAEVFLLLPPGVESHDFDPKPSDILRINNADIFIYTGKYMEPWAHDIISGLDSEKTAVVDSSAGIVLLQEQDEESGYDPHIWLNFENAIKMVDNIAAIFKSADPENAAFYAQNAKYYKLKLSSLDSKFKTGLSNCKTREFIHGGHFAFGYLAEKYNLKYVAAQGFTPASEPTPTQLISLANQIKQNGLKYVFYEELIEPKIARMLAEETGAQLILLHGAHNISKTELEKDTTFLQIMKKNLVNLKTGLGCK